jgi:hypothetical protein
MKTKTDFHRTETEFLGRSENRNGTTLFSGTRAETEFPFLTNVEFMFYCSYA